MQAGLSTKNAPSTSVVIPHFLFGAFMFLIATILILIAAPQLILPFHLNSHMLTITHLMVLGFITMIIFGALYQLIPVVMEVKLKSEFMAHLTFYLFGSGLIILVISFWEANFGPNQNWRWFEISGSLILVAVILFAINTLLTAAKTERRDIGNLFIVTGIIYLVLTVSLAILMIINFAHPFIPVNILDLLKMHINLGLIGWFLFLVIGVASKLMPMFLVIHKLPEHLLKYAYYFLNAGLILLVGAFYFYPQFWLILFASFIIFCGISLFLYFNYYAFKHRFRKNLDTGMKLSKSAFILLAFALILGIFAIIKLDFTAPFQYRIDIAFITTIIFGFLTSLILGQTYKTFPFIIWLKRYQGKVGKQKTPLPQELYSDKIAQWHTNSHLIAFILLIIGELSALVWLIQISAVIFIFTAVLYNYNVYKIIFYKKQIES